MKTYIVDSFTDKAFAGNPAGVCLLEHPISSDIMLSIAGELGFSETAFLSKKGRDNTYSIRFFSPKREIPLCGHATLASSHVIFRNTDHSKIHFINMNGLHLFAEKKGESIMMEFPSYKTIPSRAPESLLHALGIEDVVSVEFNVETQILLLEITETEILSNLTPDFVALEKSHSGINGVVVTAGSQDGEFDFHSRYFWPWSGTNEDPVTGGTHTFLTPYWGKKLGKKKMRAFQSSKRGGFMNVEIANNDNVRISGQAVIIFEGTLFL
ncbi:MAG: PhzF family phenazine biosynthesis protein [Saprospiraceae bacterium]|nr:PhzF family phenazine biosynthesis protein [Saprospiraceae bacterium]